MRRTESTASIYANRFTNNAAIMAARSIFTGQGLTLQDPFIGNRGVAAGGRGALEEPSRQSPRQQRRDNRVRNDESAISIASSG